MLQHGDHHTNAKALLAFLILVIASMILIIFLTNMSEILASGNFQTFFILSALGLSFLIGLLYLANKPHKTTRRKSKS
jgi:amino acid transporter